MFDQEYVNKKFQKEINAGIASLVLLGVMRQASEPLYGYQIAKMIGAGKENGLSMKQSALYPVLRSMESNGLLSSKVEPSVSGPPESITQLQRMEKAPCKIGNPPGNIQNHMSI